MDTKKLIHFFTTVGRLKKTKRTGWVLRGVKEPESIADHTFRMALMAWFLAKGKGLNCAKVIKMALVHDLCEVYAGDMTPHDEQVSHGLDADKNIFNRWPRQSKEKKERLVKKKHEKERESLEKIIGDLPEELQNEVESLWLEYEEGMTEEGKFLRQLDRVENVLQASEYQAENKKLPMGSFWEQIRELVDDPDLISFVKAVDAHFYRKDQRQA